MALTLREVRDEDLPLLFEQWADPVAVHMAAFTRPDHSGKMRTMPPTATISTYSIARNLDWLSSAPRLGPTSATTGSMTTIGTAIMRATKTGFPGIPSTYHRLS